MGQVQAGGRCFLPGQAAASFTFTSALPVQVLKGMAPIIEPYLDPNAEGACRDQYTAWRKS